MSQIRIGIFTNEDNETDALDWAEKVASDLVEWGYFDYVGEDTHFMTISKAQKIIDDYLSHTQELLSKSLVHIREKMAVMSNQEIIDDTMMQYHFRTVGRYGGYPIFLYDNEGVGIRSKPHLKEVITYNQHIVLKYMGF